MFAIRLRVSPWSARCSPRSVGRSTRIWPSSCFTPISRFLRSESSPFGPFTLTSSGSMEISTPSGTATGCFPMRLISPSPDPRHELAADAGAARLVAGHDAAGGRHDRGSHAALDLRHRAGLDVLATAGPGDPLDPLDHGLAVLRVLQPHAQDAAHAGRLDGEVLDVALLAQDARDLRLEVRGGHLDVVAVGVQAVADARQEVCDGVGHRHGATSSTSSCRGSCPRAGSRARRSGRARTCAGRRAGGRTACSGCSSWSGTWTRAAGGPAVTSLPSTRSPSRCSRPPAALPWPEPASRTPPGSLPSTPRMPPPRPPPLDGPPRDGAPPRPRPPRPRPRCQARPPARTASPTL